MENMKENREQSGKTAGRAWDSSTLTPGELREMESMRKSILTAPSFNSRQCDAAEAALESFIRRMDAKYGVSGWSVYDLVSGG